jgi:hypothetical protein
MTSASGCWPSKAATFHGMTSVDLGEVAPRYRPVLYAAIRRAHERVTREGGLENLRAGGDWWAGWLGHFDDLVEMLRRCEAGEPPQDSIRTCATSSQHGDAGWGQAGESQGGRELARNAESEQCPLVGVAVSGIRWGAEHSHGAAVPPWTWGPPEELHDLPRHDSDGNVVLDGHVLDASSLSYRDRCCRLPQVVAATAGDIARQWRCGPGRRHGSSSPRCRKVQERVNRGRPRLVDRMGGVGAVRGSSLL